MSPQSHIATLEIRIYDRQDTGYPVELTLESTSGKQEFRRAYLDPNFLPWVSTRSLTEDGERLFDWLFADDQLRTAWAEARGRYPQRRILLRINANIPEFHIIPWELLQDTTAGSVSLGLASSTNTPFSRYLAHRQEPGAPTLKSNIKMLVAIANPDNLEEYGLDAIDVDTELTSLEEATHGLDVELRPLQQPWTLKDLETELTQEYQVLHFIGHGRYSDAAERAVLYLADEKNQVRLVYEYEFAAMLQRQRSEERQLRLIFLASCQTATRSPADAFRGYAPQLVNAGIPAVLAMQDLVAVETARTFTHTFYQKLPQHGQVDLACNQARSSILTGKLTGSSIPVLFNRLPNGQLFKTAQSEEKQEDVGGVHIGDVDGSINDTTIAGRDVHVRGDKTTVGDISDSIVAIGRDVLVTVKNFFLESDKAKNLKLSIAHPKLLSKRLSSPFLVTIYPQKERTTVEKLVIQELKDHDISEHINDTNLVPGHTVIITFSSPAIEFSKPITKRIEKGITTTSFTGKPRDTCSPGTHSALLSIVDKETGLEYVSKTINVEVLDFAFDHVSRPHLFIALSTITALGALITFTLTFLGQFDTVFGYSSGTAASILGGIIATRYHSLYKAPSIITVGDDQVKVSNSSNRAGVRIGWGGVAIITVIAIILMANAGVFRAVTSIFSTFATSTPPSNLPEHDSRYVRYNEDSDRVIVFIHGFTGNSTATWTNEQTGTYWPDLLSKDATFDDYNIYVYEYSTTLFNERQSIDEITEDVRLFFNADDVTNHEEIVFLVHSMGGVIIRAYLNKYRDVAENVRFIYFFSTPTTGSQVANLGSVFIDNPQLQQLTKMTSASYLADVQRQWLAADHSIDSYCAYELQPTSGILIVGQGSATNLCNKRLDPIEANHIDIVEPASDRDVRYLVFKSAFVESVPPVPTQTPTPISTPTPTETPTSSTPTPLLTETVPLSPTISSTWINRIDGAEYFFVPSGIFTMGFAIDDPETGKYDETIDAPQHQVFIEDFWIKSTEVTNAQYAACVADGSCIEPDNDYWNNENFENHPVVNVTLDKARAYAEWMGGSLPNEAQWEKACRGIESLKYPWGNEEPSDKYMNFDNPSGKRDIRPVGRFEHGASPYGALDMAGNVLEWTNSLLKDYPFKAGDGREQPETNGLRALRGGAVSYDSFKFRCANRSDSYEKNHQEFNVGFRVVFP